MSALRVVLDTSVLVSGFACPGSVPGRIGAAWRQGGLEVVLSRYILDELVRVLPRLPRVHLTQTEIRDLADSFMFIADVVEPEGVQDATLRDPASVLLPYNPAGRVPALLLDDGSTITETTPVLMVLDSLVAPDRRLLPGPDAPRALAAWPRAGHAGRHRGVEPGIAPPGA